MLQLFNRLMPREHKFFPQFEEHARTIRKAAEALGTMLHSPDTSPRCCDEVVRLEQRADEITREVLLGVRSTFITPFDRGDIKDLITAMDDAIDEIQKTAKAIVLFEMTAFEPTMGAMADAIVECAELVERAMPLLSSVSENAGTQPPSACFWASSPSPSSSISSMDYTTPRTRSPRSYPPVCWRRARRCSGLAFSILSRSSFSVFTSRRRSALASYRPVWSTRG
jgi:hypothetical protein